MATSTGPSSRHTAAQFRISAFVAVTILSGASLLSSSGSASAHNSVTSVIPAEKSTVTEQPGFVTLTTEEPVLNVGDLSTLVDVVGPDGLHYGDCPIVNNLIIATPAKLGAAGTYTVSWRIVSEDGHPVSGQWAFQWAPTSGEELATGAATAPTCITSNTDATATARNTETKSAETKPTDKIGSTWIAAGIAAATIALLAAVLARHFKNRREDNDPTRPPNGDR